MGSQKGGQGSPRPGRYLLGGPMERELKQITRRMGIYDRHRSQFPQKAQAGDVGALIELYERWRLRLPLVEGRIGVTLPWHKAEGEMGRRGAGVKG